MAPEDVTPSHPADPLPQAEGMPAIEDAYAPEEASDRAVGEDDPHLLDSTSRALESDEVEAANDVEGSSRPAEPKSLVEAQHDDASDTGTVADEEIRVQAPAGPELPDWDNELSAHRIVAELKRIEADVRRLIQDRDTRRKRRLGGTRRWRELEEDLVHWRYSGRFDEQALRQVQDLIAKRHHLFRRLRYLASTRRTWNT